MHQQIDYGPDDEIDAQTALTWFRRDGEIFECVKSAYRTLDRRYRMWRRNSQGRGGTVAYLPVALLRAAGAMTSTPVRKARRPKQAPRVVPHFRWKTR